MFNFGVGVVDFKWQNWCWTAIRRSSSSIPIKCVEYKANDSCRAAAPPLFVFVGQILSLLNFLFYLWREKDWWQMFINKDGVQLNQSKLLNIQPVPDLSQIVPFFPPLPYRQNTLTSISPPRMWHSHADTTMNSSRPNAQLASSGAMYSFGETLLLFHAAFPPPPTILPWPPNLYSFFLAYCGSKQ